ncbi:MAG TPA: beta-ketoacyl-ACP synthase III [Candidatus Angelobacter sp.]|nr:beta-ketoacyl-ACP synthase III [Candidatus Angelobacter sp.]
MKAIVSGLGGWLPPEVVSNAHISSTLDTTPEWIETRTGIRERRRVSDGLSTRDLAVKAGRQALKSAGDCKVDLVIVASTCPDRLCPSVAPEVAALLGLGGVAAYDINSACSGFVYGLATATGFIGSGVAESVLLIGSETISPFINPADRGTRPIFGDGAGAVVFRKGSEGDPGAIGPIDLGSDGSNSGLIVIPGGGARQRSATGLGHDAEANEDWYVRMDGRATFVQAVSRMTQSAQTVLARANWECADVDWFIGHQANIRILHGVANELGLPLCKVASNIDRTGNTLAASIPILLNDMAVSGKLKPGHRLLMGAFGAGLSWGSTVLVWPDIAVETIA